MTLAPETRVLLTDALRPPAGYGMDVAVGTTYSLDLMSMLLAPLSFALHDRMSLSEVESADPVRLLEAVRRHSAHTTVFCQAGGIHVPGAYRSILAFVEDSVTEVVAPTEGAIFHPKVWALRFVDAQGSHVHRAVVLSRNLTQDRSWDTALVLDEDVQGTVPAAPLAEFVSRLPGLAVRGVDATREAEIADLVRTLTGVRFAAPAPFTAGELLPIGLSSGEVWPFPERASKLLAISPFLSAAAVQSLGAVASERHLVSRIETLEYLGSRALEGWDLNVLQRLAEVQAGEDVGAAERSLDETSTTRDGLHAKTFVLDLASRESLVVTGSANLTSRRWGRNVEFDAAFTGPTSECGVERVLNGTKDAPGLTRMLENVELADADGVIDPQREVSDRVEAFHRRLAEAGLFLRVNALDGERVKVDLVAVTQEPIGDTAVWMVSVPHQRHELGNTQPWVVAQDSVTPFVAVETSDGSGESRVTRRCVVKATLEGDVSDRRRNALTTVLKTPQDVLRYLVFLLGDPAYDALVAELAGAEAGGRWAKPGSSLDAALFEPLVRATGRDEAALARIASAVEELREAPDGPELLPEGFDALWDVVWAVHQEVR